MNKKNNDQMTWGQLKQALSYLSVLVAAIALLVTMKYDIQRSKDDIGDIKMTQKDMSGEIEEIKKEQVRQGKNQVKIMTKLGIDEELSKANPAIVVAQKPNPTPTFSYFQSNYTIYPNSPTQPTQHPDKTQSTATPDPVASISTIPPIVLPVTPIVDQILKQIPKLLN